MKHIFLNSAMISIGLSLMGDAVSARYPAQVAPKFQKEGKAELANLWNGAYVGINLGGAFIHADVKANQLGFVSSTGACSNQTNFSSFYPGVQLGYSHKINSKLVLGALGDYSYNVNKNNSFECPCDLNFAIKDRFSIKESMQGSLLGRVGYILSDNLLPFFVGGVSFSDLGIKYSNEGSDYYSRNATQTGWRLGAGLEWKITPTWSLGAQYNYTDYNKLKLQLPIIYDLADVNGHASMHLITNNIQISFNHWFS